MLGSSPLLEKIRIKARERGSDVLVSIGSQGCEQTAEIDMQGLGRRLLPEIGGRGGWERRFSLCPKQSLNNYGMNKKVKAERLQCADAKLAEGETSGFLLAVQPLETSLMQSIRLLNCKLCSSVARVE